MDCQFRTNIDCCKKFMGHISGMDIEPQVGDLVLVYKDTGIELYLKVVARTWWTYYSEKKLICDLHLPNWIASIPELEGLYRL